MQWCHQFSALSNFYCFKYKIRGSETTITKIQQQFRSFNNLFFMGTLFEYNVGTISTVTTIRFNVEWKYNSYKVTYSFMY